jgi:hypothetical protein
MTTPVGARWPSAMQGRRECVVDNRVTAVAETLVQIVEDVS